MIMSVLLAFGNTLFAQVKTQIIAHRGYWNTEGSAENTISSLENAHKAELYGSEFDINMTSDGVLVVCHGPPRPELRRFVIGIRWFGEREITEGFAQNLQREFDTGHSADILRVSPLKLGSYAGGDKHREKGIPVNVAVVYGVVKHFTQLVHGVIQIQFVVCGNHRLSTPL